MSTDIGSTFFKLVSCSRLIDQDKDKDIDINKDIDIEICLWVKKTKSVTMA